MLLRSDMVASKGVDTNVCVTTCVRPIGLAMIAVAAVVTPMGLYESVDMTHDILLANSTTLPTLAEFEHGPLRIQW
jgi:hypothetical protein